MKTQSGIALIKVLLVTSLLLGMGAFASRGARTELRVSLYNLQAKQALAVAEAGLDHAVDLLNEDRSQGFTREVATGTGGRLQAIGDGDEKEFPLDSGTWWQYAALGDGGYHVRVEDNWDEKGGTANDPFSDKDGVVRIVSRGLSGAGDRTIEALAHLVLGPECALNSNQKMTITGNTGLSGLNGCAHSNANMKLDGDASFQIAPTASGTMQIGLSTNVTVEGQRVCSNAFECGAFAKAHSQWDTRRYPTVRPFAFGYYEDNGTAEGQIVGDAINVAQAVNDIPPVNNIPAGYRLTDDCKIYPASDNWGCADAEALGRCPGTGPQHDLPSSNPVRSSFSCNDKVSPTEWSVSSNHQDGVYLVEGYLKIGGSPASWRATIVALNSVEVTGTPTMLPYPVPESSPLHQVLLVSGNDIKLRGKFGAGDANAAIYAHQQINFGGSAEIYGYVLAEDGRRSWTGDPAPTYSSGKNLAGESRINLNLDSVDLNEVKGNVMIWYSGLDTALYPSRLTLLGWHSAGY